MKCAFRAAIYCSIFSFLLIDVFAGQLTVPENRKFDLKFQEPKNIDFDPETFVMRGRENGTRYDLRLSATVQHLGNTLWTYEGAVIGYHREFDVGTYDCGIQMREVEKGVLIPMFGAVCRMSDPFHGEIVPDDQIPMGLEHPGKRIAIPHRWSFSVGVPRANFGGKLVNLEISEISADQLQPKAVARVQRGFFMSRDSALEAGALPNALKLGADLTPPDHPHDVEPKTDYFELKVGQTLHLLDYLRRFKVVGIVPRDLKVKISGWVLLEEIDITADDRRRMEEWAGRIARTKVPIRKKRVNPLRPADL